MGDSRRMQLSLSLAQLSATSDDQRRPATTSDLQPRPATTSDGWDDCSLDFPEHSPSQLWLTPCPAVRHGSTRRLNMSPSAGAGSCIRPAPPRPAPPRPAPPRRAALPGDVRRCAARRGRPSAVKLALTSCHRPADMAARQARVMWAGQPFRPARSDRSSPEFGVTRESGKSPGSGGDVWGSPGRVRGPGATFGGVREGVCSPDRGVVRSADQSLERDAVRKPGHGWSGI